MRRSLPLGFGGRLFVLNAMREAKFQNLLAQLVNNLVDKTKSQKRRQGYLDALQKCTLPAARECRYGSRDAHLVPCVGWSSDWEAETQDHTGRLGDETNQVEGHGGLIGRAVGTRWGPV